MGRESNGELLQLASSEFALFITVDKNVQYQHVIGNYNIAVVVLDAVSNKYEELAVLMPALRDLTPCSTIRSHSLTGFSGIVGSRNPSPGDV